MKFAAKLRLALLTVSFGVSALSVQGQIASRAAGASSQDTGRSSSAPQSERPVAIHIDLSKKVGSYTPIYSWFGYDESNYTTMKYGKQLLGELHDLSPVQVHVWAHHLLTSGNGVAELKWSSSNVFSLDPSGKAMYDFTITDETFDEYKKADRLAALLREAEPTETSGTTQAGSIGARWYFVALATAAIAIS